jgi:c-di-GMP-binding flagellar brake protein YcgR
MKKEEQEIKSRVGIVDFEKRRYPRFRVELPIEYYRIDSSISHPSRTINGSEGGLLIYFSEQMDIGQHLRMKLFFTSGPKLDTIEAMVEVVWTEIHLGEGWGDYRSGVKFIDIFPDDMRKLKNFLMSLSQ